MKKENVLKKEKDAALAVTGLEDAALAVTGLEKAEQPPLVQCVCVKAFTAHGDFKPGDIIRCTKNQFESWRWHGYVQVKEKEK